MFKFNQVYGDNFVIGRQVIIKRCKVARNLNRDDYRIVLCGIMRGILLAIYEHDIELFIVD